MRRMRILGAVVLVGTASLVVAGCEALERGLGCGKYQELRDIETADQELLESVPVDGPYPMALVLSQTAVNDLLRAVTDQDLPSVRKSFDGFTVRLSPKLPLIQIASVAGCADCVLADMDFDLAVAVDGLGTFNGSGAALGGLPISLVPSTVKQTNLIAGLSQVSLQDLDLELEGLSLDAIPALESAVEGMAQDYLREELGDRELARLDSWAIGQGQVVLAGRGPRIFPDHKTILVGMHTNLPVAEGTTLAEQATLPEGAEVGLTFHPGVLLGMTKRLLGEGEIPRDYDEEGNADPEGDRHVAMLSMQSSDAGLLDTAFRVYQLDGLCGTVDVGAKLGLSITERGLTFQAQDLRVLDGQGAGEILDEAQWLSGDFLQSLLGNLELTVGYDEIAVGADGQAAGFSATSLNVDGRGLTVYLDVLRN